jgi:hypothetical protein
MVWTILGAVSLFFNITNTEKLVSDNSELISTTKINLVSKTNILAASNLTYIADGHSKKRILVTSNETRRNQSRKDTIHQDNAPALKEVVKTKMALKLDIVTYRIFFNGSIEKIIPKVIAPGNENRYKYEYLPEKGRAIDLGSYKIHKTKAFRGADDEFVNLINLETVPKYFKKDKYQYHFNIDSRRSFVNEQTLASFLGAMLEVNYLDISCNGFSHKDGSSLPSRSHINGNNGDFKYFRLDKTLECGPGTSLNISKAPQSLDYSRQNEWNDALYKFGWKKILGWTYTIKKTTKKLHHITHKTSNHHHHLHVQNYEPDFKEIKQ